MKAALAILLLLLPTAIGHSQNAEPVCVTNQNAPPVSAYYWPPDTAVRVYLVRDMFTDEQMQTLRAAMDNWTRVAKQVGAGVNFRYAGLTEELVTCNGCLTVTRREVFKTDRKHYAFFNPLQKDESGLLVSAWIDFDFSTTDAQALRGFMAHELGHGMGLWDCKSCKKRETIMNAFPGINKHNGLIEPSPCDVAVVKNVYELERRVADNSADKSQSSGDH
jgi:hypothetical protein